MVSGCSSVCGARLGASWILVEIVTTITSGYLYFICPPLAAAMRTDSTTPARQWIALTMFWCFVHHFLSWFDWLEAHPWCNEARWCFTLAPGYCYKSEMWLCPTVSRCYEAAWYIAPQYSCPRHITHSLSRVTCTLWPWHAVYSRNVRKLLFSLQRP